MLYLPLFLLISTTLAQNLQFRLQVHHPHEDSNIIGFQLQAIDSSLSRASPNILHAPGVVAFINGFLKAPNSTHIIVNRDLVLSDTLNTSLLLLPADPLSSSLVFPPGRSYFMQFSLNQSLCQSRQNKMATNAISNSIDGCTHVLASFVSKNISSQSIQSWPLFWYTPRNNSISIIPSNYIELASYTTAFPDDTIPCVLLQLLGAITILVSFVFFYKLYCVLKEYQSRSPLGSIASKPTMTCCQSSTGSKNEKTPLIPKKMPEPVHVRLVLDPDRDPFLPGC